MMKLITKSATAAAVLTTLAAFVPLASADDGATLEISVQDHQFKPAEVKAAAGTPIVFKIKNLSASPVEFESEPLQVETVIKANAEGIIKVKPQKPGRYVFF